MYSTAILVLHKYVRLHLIKIQQKRSSRSKLAAMWLHVVPKPNDIVFQITVFYKEYFVS